MKISQLLEQPQPLIIWAEPNPDIDEFYKITDIPNTITEDQLTNLCKKSFPIMLKRFNEQDELYNIADKVTFTYWISVRIAPPNHQGLDQHTPHSMTWKEFVEHYMYYNNQWEEEHGYNDNDFD